MQISRNYSKAQRKSEFELLANENSSEIYMKSNKVIENDVDFMDLNFLSKN